MKKMLFAIFFLFPFSLMNAQKELWSVNTGVHQVGTFQQVYFGNMTKYDLNGENPVVMHEFNGLNGYYPQGKLFLASNGKLYGTTTYGGSSFISVNNSNDYGYGTLFEYDLVLNKYKILKNFILSATSAYQPNFGLIEPFPNMLYGVGGFRIFKFDLNNSTFYDIQGLNLNLTGARFTSELTKASDGNLYGTANYFSVCGGSSTPSPYMKGALIKVNTTTNITTATTLNCNIADGISNPYYKLYETSQGKLMGINGFGLYFAQNNIDLISTDGGIFEFDINSNLLTRKFDFFKNITGFGLNEMNDAGNGIFYGACETSTKLSICASPPNPPDTSFPLAGTIWKYNANSNVLDIMKEIGTCDNIDDDYLARNPTSIFKTSAGHFMCTNTTQITTQGYFKYDPVTNLVKLPVLNYLNPDYLKFLKPANFIEICRKPSYQEFLPNTYTPEQGTAFTYNIQNTNATTYVWKKGTTILPAQTTGILNLPSVTTNDTGIYTCTMTNECGTTVTMPLNINVTNLATETIDNYAAFISLYPNPTKGSINLKFPENRGLKAIGFKVTNLLGQVVLQNDIAKNNTATTITIDTAGFANGIYNVTLVTDKGKWNGKFVKE